jgi:hypothetical protein
MTPYLRAGPVYVGGILVFTMTRDVMPLENVKASDVVRENGTVPKPGDPMSDLENRVVMGTVEFYQ